MKSRTIQNLSAVLILGLGLAACTHAHSPSAPETTGGEAGGGGNTIVALSTRADVEEAIKDAHASLVYQFTDSMSLLFHLFDCSDNYGGPVISEKANRDLQNPRVATILLDFSQNCKDLGAGMSSIPRFEAIEAQTKIEAKEQGPCRTEGGVDRDGAVVHPKDPQSPICLSVEALEKLPKELMRAQVLGLIAHEYTHKLGYGEDDAILMQKFFISEIASNRLESRGQLAGSIRQLDKTLQENIEKLATSDDICEAAQLVDYDVREFEAKYVLIRETNLWVNDSVEGQCFNELAGQFLMPNLLSSITCLSGKNAKPRIIDGLKSVDRDVKEMMTLVPKVIPVTY
jgi:hypothetical protein